MTRYADRGYAGRRLAHALGQYDSNPDVIVLGLPRGGVLVAAEVAESLHAPLDVFTVRKLGVPWNRELAVGAIASGDVMILDHDSMRLLGLTMDALQPVIDAEHLELARRDRVFRGTRPALRLAGKIVIVVDDGLATGATMTAAVDAIRKLGAARIVAAVPVASDSACEALHERADECVCLEIPRSFYGVGYWYDDFHDVSDAEVLAALADHPPAAQPA